MATEAKKSDATTTWDSDVEVSSDDEQQDNNNKQPGTVDDNKQASQESSTSSTKLKPPTKPAPATQDAEQTKPKAPPQNDPVNLRLSFFDHYNDSKVYSKIRKRRIQKRLNTEETKMGHDDNDTDANNERFDHQRDEEQMDSSTNTAVAKKVTLNDLKSHRILYEMNNYECKWFWIDSLPTDDRNEYIWIQQYANINLFEQQQQDAQQRTNDGALEETKDEQKELEYMDIEDAISNNNMIERESLREFDHNLNEARKSVINSPLFPELGCWGYCKEFYVTLCDWNAEGVLSIKYISDESKRSTAESKALQTCNGYWQRMRYEMDVSKNGKYIAILFDRYCVIRNAVNNFSVDVQKIALPASFWEFTQFRFVKWSDHNEVLAVSSHANDIVIYAPNAENSQLDEILAFNDKCEAGAKITGLVWRRCSSSFNTYVPNKAISSTITKTAGNGNDEESFYWLELIILYSNGELHRKGVKINASSKQVIQFEDNVRSTVIHFPHRKVTKWIYDGMDYFEHTQNQNLSFLAISCIPQKLLDTKPRQSRLGHGLMLCRFDGEQVVVIKHYNSTIPSNSWFKVDSVCFTMADRRAKLHGREVNISEDGKHVLCVDLRGNTELFQHEYTGNEHTLELMAKIGNTREMSYGSYHSDSRIYTMKWWDNESIIILFCDNTFCITPIRSVVFYNQRDLKWSINYLGYEREQLYGLPIITKTVPIENKDEETKCDQDKDLRMFFILEINEAYLRRKDDQHLNIIDHAANDIDRKQNEIYGWRKYRSIALSTFSSITSLQLFKKYLEENMYDKALQIADMFKLNADKAYQSQFDYLINQYNQRNEQQPSSQSDSQQQQQQQQQQHKIGSEWIEILQNVQDELWIVDTLLNVSLCNLDILDRLLLYGLDMVEHSEKLREARPNAFAQFMKYRERLASLKEISSKVADLDFKQLIDDHYKQLSTRSVTTVTFCNYLLFRNANIIDIAYTFAAKNWLEALDTIFTYHWHEISKRDRLKILSWIPTTTDPRFCSNIFPSVSTPTWNTNRWYAQQFGLQPDEGDDKDDALSSQQIADWYKARIYSVDETTGNVELSWVWCHYAVTEKQIESLRPLFETVQLFYCIVYEFGGTDTVSLKTFESMQPESRFLFAISNSDHDSIVNDIETRSQHFEFERDVSLILLGICPKLAEMGKIDLVAAILNSHHVFDLLSVIKQYLSSSNSIFQQKASSPPPSTRSSRKAGSNPARGDSKEDEDDEWDEFEDNFSDQEEQQEQSEEIPTVEASSYDIEYDKMNETDLLIEYGLLCALRCSQYTEENVLKIWDGFDKLLTAINHITKESDNLLGLITATHEMPQRIAQFTALIKGGTQLSKTYQIHRSLQFYYTLFHIGHSHEDQGLFRKKIFNQIDARQTIVEIKKWKQILNVSSHQLQHYDALYSLATETEPVIDHEEICKALHNLAVDIAIELFRGIQQKARKYQDDEQWKELRNDLLNFQHQLFSFISTERIELLFFSIVFTSCCFDYIQKSMKLDPPPISNENLIKLSLQTANELIDASVSVESGTLADAQKCLSLIPKNYRTKQVWSLIDLISAVQVLHAEFNYDVIPYQLRQQFDASLISKDNRYFTEKQVEFFDNVLKSNSSKNYLKKDALLQVAENLSFGNDEHKIQLLCMVADYALKQMEKHFKSSDKISRKSGLKCQLYAYEIYQEIFQKNLLKTSKKYPKYIMSLLWNICSKLMESTTKITETSSNYYKSQQKLQLLSHSLTTSASNKIYKILELWQSVNCNDHYFNIIHSMALSLRKRRGDYISDSDDTDNDEHAQHAAMDYSHDWDDFIHDITKRQPAFKSMSAAQIHRQVEMNEMQKMVDIYFETDPDLLRDHENEEVYSILCNTNPEWNQLNLLSNSLIPCSSVANDYLQPNTKESFEALVLSIVKNIYLCDVSELIAFLLLIDDVDLMHKSFSEVMAVKNIPKNRKLQILKIAVQYFTYQLVNAMQNVEYDENEIYMLPANSTDVFSWELVADEESSDEDVSKATIQDIVRCEAIGNIADAKIKKCHRKATALLDKWCKVTGK